MTDIIVITAIIQTTQSHGSSWWHHKKKSIRSWYHHDILKIFVMGVTFFKLMYFNRKHLLWSQYDSFCQSGCSREAGYSFAIIGMFSPITAVLISMYLPDLITVYICISFIVIISVLYGIRKLYCFVVYWYFQR